MFSYVTAPLAAGFDESQLNPEYLEWLENGKEGAAPSMQDFSYLAESYARLHTARNAAVLPAEYDLRDYGRVTPVINQGTLNLCWAVAASDATAGTLLEQFPQMAFSATHTAWFSKLGAEEYEYFQQDSPYDYGGTDGTVVGSWAAWKGPVATDLAPNEVLSDDPEVYEESDRWQADYHLQDAYYLPFGLTYSNVLQIPQELTKQLLMEEGPLTISYYTGDMNAYRADTYAWYNDEYHYADHTVVLVGWDDDYPKENFAEGKQPEPGWYKTAGEPVGETTGIFGFPMRMPALKAALPIAWRKRTITLPIISMTPLAGVCPSILWKTGRRI